MENKALKMKFDYVNRALRIQFKKLGFLVGRHPSWFIVLPFIFSIVMLTAVLKISFLRELDSIFASSSGRAMRQKRILDSLYPVNASYNFEVSKFSDKGEFGSVLVLAKDGGSMLRENMFSEVLEVDRIVRSITVEGSNFSQLCAKYGNKCQENLIFKILNKTGIRNIENGHYFLKYPFEFDRNTLKYTITGLNFGGIEKDHEGNIKSASVIRLMYFLDYSNPDKRQIAVKWEERFLETVKGLKAEGINLFRFTARSLENEIAKVTLVSLPFGMIAAATIFVFSFFVCMTNSIVRCKPLIGIFGATSALISVGTAFGFVVYCGVPYVDLNTSIPFLMLGIGIDDTFVLLAAWRRTDPKEDVPQRMAQTYSEAAVSITVTSITNFLSFFIGIFSPYPCFHIFCVYAASSVLFTYLYQVTFFGGWMVVSGYREKRNLNPFTFRPMQCTQNGHVRSVLTELLSKYPTKETDFADWFSRELFGNKIGKALIRSDVKTLVSIVYVMYIGVAIWGCVHVRDGLKYEDIFPDNSYAADYTRVHLKYLTEYAHRIHIVITEKLDYSDRETQEKIEELLNTFESSPYISNFTNCWLRTFLQFTKIKKLHFSFGSFNLTRKDEFLEAARVFLKLPWGKMFVDDVVFSDDGMDIVSSRFIVTSYKTSNSTMQEKLLLEVNRIADESPIAIITHEAWFPFYEQAINVAKSSVVSLLIAIATMSVVFFSFMPDVGYTVCVGLIVSSIQIGIIGYMTLWNVSRDVVSVISLLMSVGFSVDYSAHMAYAYINSSKMKPEERLQDALGDVGVAICQGSISTLLGSVFLGLVPSAIMRVLFKIMFLVISLATLHSIFILPLLFTTLDKSLAKCNCVRKRMDVRQASVHDVADVRSSEGLNI